LSRQAISPDAEASLRAELSTQIASAQSDIENRLAVLTEALARGGDGGALAQAQSQLIALARLQRRVTDAGAGGLSTMRGEVTAMVAATQGITQTSSASGAQAFQLGQLSLRQASEAARASASSFAHDYYDRHIFDTYLKFASTEDEEEYRGREQERKQAIDKALAERTPKGDLKALDLSIAQMNDAGAHGADKSPEFQSRLDALKTHRNQLAGALDKQPPVRTQASGDDISAVKPDASVSPDLIAGLRASGVVMPDQTGDGHGVAVGKLPAGERTRT
jgi:hypothetical protein